MPTPVELVYGPMLIGVIFNSMLYGFMVVQSFIYYMTYTRDAPWIRYFILYLFVVETLNSGCDIAIIYQPLILRFGLPEALTLFPTMFGSSPVLTVAVSTPIQIFTAWRITVVAGKRWPALIIILLSLVSFGGALWTTIAVAELRFFAGKPKLNTAGAVWFIASAAADFIITGSLTYSLTRRRTGFSKTDGAINRIIRLTIQTGLITSLFALADLLAFLISPRTAISFVWDFSLSKLYTNALLSTLNSRVGWSNLNSLSGNTENVLFGTSGNIGSVQGTIPSFNSNGRTALRSSNPSETEYELKPRVNQGETGVHITTFVETDQRV